MSFDGKCVLAMVGVYTKYDAAKVQSTMVRMVQEIADYAGTQ